MENLQGSIICYFDEFVNGTAWLEVQMPDKTKGYFMMDKVDKTYVLPIKSSLLKQAGLINMQLRITQGENIEEIPVYKSNIFYCKVKEAINSINEIPEEYPQWIDIANVKLQEINNLDIDIENSVVTITRKDGTSKSENVKGDSYIITEEDYRNIENEVMKNIEPTLEQNLVEAKQYADSIKPTKTSDLVNDSNFAKTNTNNNFSTSQTINGTLTINGDIVQNGEQYETHAEQVYTKNDEIITRDGAVGGLSDGEYAGIQAEKYDGTNNGRLGFNAKGEARVGDIGDEQPLLTRDEVENLLPGQVLVWDGTNLKAVGSSDFVKNTDIATTSKAGIIKVGGGLSTSVGYLVVSRASNSMIDAKTNQNYPIVPANLDYAVGTVKASETQSGTAKMWTSTNEDGEIGLNISTEV